MKYIIEIPDDVPFVLLRRAARREEYGKFITKVVPVAELEELNSDYINKHFGSLQDEAYQRGINDGSLDVKQRVEGAYQRGLEDGKKSTEKGCDGCKYVLCGDTEDPCWHCRRCYKDKYEPAPHSDRIEVGDIVDRYINGKFDGRGIYLGGNGEFWNCLFWKNALPITLAFPKEQFKKTGKHYDIKSILEAMRT